MLFFFCLQCVCICVCVCVCVCMCVYVSYFEFSDQECNYCNVRHQDINQQGLLPNLQREINNLNIRQTPLSNRGRAGPHSKGKIKCLLVEILQNDILCSPFTVHRLKSYHLGLSSRKFWQFLYSPTLSPKTLAIDVVLNENQK